MNQIFQHVLSYIKNRFTKEKISTGLGLILSVAAAAGYITGPQYSVISMGLNAAGMHLSSVDPNTIGLIVGAISVLAPTSKLTKRLNVGIGSQK